MNPEQWINKVKELLDKARPVDSGYYCLVIVDNEVTLKRKKDLEVHEHPLVVFTSIDVNCGLSSGRWFSIGCKLTARKDLNPEL